MPKLEARVSSVSGSDSSSVLEARDGGCGQRRSTPAPGITDTRASMFYKYGSGGPDTSHSSPRTGRRAAGRLEACTIAGEDVSGSPERPEIVRALIKTIPEFTGRDESWLPGTFATIWSIIDPDGDGPITGAEFMMPGGLYETLVANFCRHRI